MNDIIDALKDVGVPVKFQTYPGSATTYITFFNYLENVESYADNEKASEGYYTQVDVWSSGNYNVLVNSVKTALELAGFSITYITEIYESETKVFHKIIRIFKFEEVF
jgi:hypothetical protein